MNQFSGGMETVTHGWIDSVILAMRPGLIYTCILRDDGSFFDVLTGYSFFTRVRSVVRGMSVTRSVSRWAHSCCKDDVVRGGRGREGNSQRYGVYSPW